MRKSKTIHRSSDSSLTPLPAVTDIALPAPATGALGRPVTRDRILILIAVLLTAASLAAIIWYIENEFNALKLLQNYREEKQTFVQQVTDLKATRLRSYVTENTYWDEAVSFVQASEKHADSARWTRWVRDSLDAPAESAQASFVWMGARDGSVLHSNVARSAGQAAVPSLDSLHIALPYLDRTHVLRWYLTVENRVWEMHGATVHRSSDPAHRGPYFGYLIVGRPCDATFLQEIGSITYCQLSVGKRSPAAQPTRTLWQHLLPLWNEDIAHVRVTMPLKGLDGRPVAYLNGIARNPQAPAIEEAALQALIVFVLFAASILLITGLALTRWLGAPIRTLLEALLRRDPQGLETLRAEPTEFGYLADVITEFFHQERALSQAHDDLERRVSERTAELAYRAYHDALTGLPNRVLFRERLETALAALNTLSTLDINPQQRFAHSLAVLFVDLNNFKVINDSLGHEVGDGLLCAAAERMRQALPPVSLIARLGGDEFAILLEETDEAGARRASDQIALALNEPILVGGNSLSASASIGVALGRGGETPGDLLRDADIAMYDAKHQGRRLGKASCRAVFDSGMRRMAEERLELEADLRSALTNQWGLSGLRLVYQPIMDIRSGRMAGMEALLRWDHPRRGAISPSRVIPIAEETGLIHALTDWALEQACLCQSELTRQFPPEQYPGVCPAYVSVNVSAVCLQGEDSAERILRRVRAAGLAPSQVAMEITESVMARQIASIQRSIQQIRDGGMRVLMDDFGTGYSSLATLSELPLDALKIDPSFAENLGRRPETEAVMRAIVELARALHMDVICEGVERRQQRDLLRQLGCPYAQGYLFAHPFDRHEIEPWLHSLLGDKDIANPSENLWLSRLAAAPPL